MKNYKVTAECVVHVPTSTTEGATLGTLYRNSTFLGDPDSVKIKHLLDSGMIVELGSGGQPIKAEPAADEVKDAKLSIRSSKDELTAAAVAKGMPEDIALASSKPDLLAWLEAPAPAV
jgi:hypothetical protein